MFPPVLVEYFRNATEYTNLGRAPKLPAIPAAMYTLACNSQDLSEHRINRLETTRAQAAN